MVGCTFSLLSGGSCTAKLGMIGIVMRMRIKGKAVRTG